MRSLRKSLTNDTWRHYKGELDKALKHRIKDECEIAYRAALNYLERNDKTTQKYKARKAELDALLWDVYYQDLLATWVPKEALHHEVSKRKRRREKKSTDSALIDVFKEAPAPLSVKTEVTPVAQPVQSAPEISPKLISPRDVPVLEKQTDEKQSATLEVKAEVELTPSAVLVPGAVVTEKQVAKEANTLPLEQRLGYAAEPSFIVEEVTVHQSKCGRFFNCLNAKSGEGDGKKIQAVKFTR